MNLSADVIGKKLTDEITSASYTWAPMVRQDSKCYTAMNCIMLFEMEFYAVGCCIQS